MRTLSKTLVFVLCLVTAASGQFKQLAGDASEIDSLRLPVPETLAVSSKSAVLPIDGGEMLIPVENGENFKLMLIAPNSRELKISVALPNEDSFTDLREGFLSSGLTRTESQYGLEGEQFPAEVFAFDSIKTGVLRVRFDLPNGFIKADKPLGYLIASGESPYLLSSHVNTNETVVGRKFGIIASLLDKSDTRLFGNIREAKVKFQNPRGGTSEIVMVDNGDGTFIGEKFPLFYGKYIAQVSVKGITPEGSEFIRTTEHIIYAGRRAEIGNSAGVKQIDDVRFRVDIPVNGLRNNQKVIAHAEVWARDGEGNETPVAWIGGMALAERRGTRIPLSLDSRWLARSSAKESFELRNVRLQDADYFTTLGTADRVSLPSIDLPEPALDFNGEITEEMRTGKRPEIEPTSAVGGKLMLVHGYCSGANPWNPAQFSSSISFLDPNANRSHDQFAQRIANFGAAYPSFGVVAHSQGGAAALHLYTYYWSGLDYATGSRLIQSVGTPYQGTSLAGNLALLGQIFGAGCGSNYDLTYNGAAAWLAGIPSWARAKVYYHTTSFADVWWRYDYCNLASDVVLSDPDDGVIERAKGQLSGANNMGHKTGWCHTSGMRDPAQTSDSSRNATMNANAAR